MGKMNKLSDFGQSPTVSPPPEENIVEPAAAETTAVVDTDIPVKSNAVISKVNKKSKQPEILVNINIKMRQSQQEWLADTAKRVRRNNTEPVPAKDRVYPQHLIGLAVDLLKSADIDWDEVKTLADIEGQLFQSK
jgi:hypothetical protein